ncbi:MAG: phosphoglucosamine mutase [Bacteroidota bacterium]
MTLIKSISGIRGTIGGKPDEGLTPIDVVKYTAAYVTLIKKNVTGRCKVVVGRDARISGPMVEQLVLGTLQGMGVDVIHLGLSTTPTVEVAVDHFGASGGIILTASHNPAQWNALKLLNHKGEFISAAEGQEVLSIAEQNDYVFAEVTELGTVTTDTTFTAEHIRMIMADELVDAEAIRAANFRIVVDGVNSSGGIVIPQLLTALGVQTITNINGEPTGHFAHNPEPLPEHLTEMTAIVQSEKAHLGIVVDPDVDRLAFVCEDGSMFGEEYTLVAVADYVLQHRKGNTVSNLSSTRALRDVTRGHGGEHFAAAVGEVNVVEKMKEVNAVIGGEGNGGVIYPPLHYGRDAMMGVALFLTHLAKTGMTMTALKKSYPNYFMSKNKIDLNPSINVDKVLEKTHQNYRNEEVNTIDGVKIDFSEGWVHLRKSNTEPIIRIYAEGATAEKADALANQVIEEIHKIVS